MAFQYRRTGTGRKTGQLKMAETIIVLIIFFFLLVFGIVFYAKVQRYINQGKSSESNELKALQILQKAQNLPEIQCTKDGNADYDCIDIVKLNAFSEVSGSNAEIYKKIFPDTRISAIAAYPPHDPWPIFENVYDGDYINFTIPVTLFNATTDQYYFGMLIVEVYYNASG
jgi:hypothetical protein